MEFLRKYRKNIFIASMTTIFLVLIVPLVINYLFTVPALCRFLGVDWEVADALSYYGTIISTIAAIAGVFLSIQYAQKNYREDERNRIRPYLALTYFRTKPKYNVFDPRDIGKEDGEEDNSQYKEYILEKLYILISPDKVDYKDGLTKNQIQILKTGGALWEPTQTGARLIEKLYLSLPCECENVGNGTAIDLRVSLYREGKDGDAIKYANMFTLQTGKSIYLHIFSEEFVKEICGNYTLCFRYSDLIGNRYVQKFSVELGWNEEKQKYFKSVDLIGIQTTEAQ